MNVFATGWTEFAELDCAPGVGSTAISSFTLELEECKETCANARIQGCTAIAYLASTDSCHLSKEVEFQECSKGEEAKVASGEYWNTYVMGQGEHSESNWA